jgi:hypothetical protein
MEKIEVQERFTGKTTAQADGVDQVFAYWE